MPVDIQLLTGVTTATLTTILLKRGLRNVWLRGARPLRPGMPRIVGRAFTLRFVPAREDLATPESWSAPTSSSSRARTAARSSRPARSPGPVPWPGTAMRTRWPA